MFERSRHADKRGQIQDSQGMNVEVLNAPYRLLSGSEEKNLPEFRGGFSCT
jgi:hypothetical protein